MKLKIVFSVIIFFTIFALIYGVFGKKYFKQKIDNRLIDAILSESFITRKPACIFVFSNKDEQKKWAELKADTFVAEKLNSVLTHIIHNKYLKDKFPNIFGKDINSGLLILSFKGDKIYFEPGMLDKTDVVPALENSINYNNKMIDMELSAKKEFAKIKKVYGEKNYLTAMDNLRKFLYVYSNTEPEKEARGLLLKIGETPEFKGKFNENRDKSNLKVLLNKAKEDLQYKKYFSFERTVASIIQANPHSPEADEAKKMKKEMEKLSSEKFQAATLLYRQKKYVEAMEAFQSLHEQYKGTHWDLFITGKIQQIESDKEYQGYLKKYQLNLQAKNIFKRAETAFDKKDFDTAEQYYSSIIRLYRESDYYEQSKNRLNQMTNMKMNRIEFDNDNDTGYY